MKLLLMVAVLLWLALFNSAMASCHQNAEPSVAQQVEGVLLPSVLPIDVVEHAPEHPCQGCDGQCSASCSSVSALPMMALMVLPDSSRSVCPLRVTATLSGYPLGLLRPPSVLIG